MEREHAPDLGPRGLFLVGFFFELGLVVIAALLGYWSLGTPFPFRFVLDLRGSLWGLVATVPLLILAFVLTSKVGDRLPFLRRIEAKLKEFLSGGVCGMTAQEVVLLAAAAGVGEEILFRGVVQTLFERWGLLGASLIFGLLHAITPAYFVLAALLGLYLGWLYDATGNLLAPMLVHWLYDAAALLLLRRKWRAEEEGTNG